MSGSKSDQETANRFEEGQENSHLANDSSENIPPFHFHHLGLLEIDIPALCHVMLINETEDQRSIANRLAAAEVSLTPLALRCIIRRRK
jgi:hypothetical protein